LSVLISLISSQGGQQEDAEEFLGFYLDTLEEELLYIQNSLASPPPPSLLSSSKKQSVEEKEELDIPEDGWLEVGKKNRTIITRTVSLFFISDSLLEFEKKNRLKLSRVLLHGFLVGGSSRLSELLDNEIRYSQKTGDHYDSIFK